MSLFNVTLYASIFRSSSRSISISFLDAYILPTLYPAVICLSEFVYTSTYDTSLFVASIGAPVKMPSNSSMILFCSKIHCDIIFSVLNEKSDEPFYHLDKYSISLKKLNRVLITILLSWINPLKPDPMYLELPIIPILIGSL